MAFGRDRFSSCGLGMPWLTNRSGCLAAQGAGPLLLRLPKQDAAHELAGVHGRGRQRPPETLRGGKLAGRPALLHVAPQRYKAADGSRSMAQPLQLLIDKALGKALLRQALGVLHQPFDQHASFRVAEASCQSLVAQDGTEKRLYAHRNPLPRGPDDGAAEPLVAQFPCLADGKRSTYTRSFASWQRQPDATTRPGCLLRRPPLLSKQPQFTQSCTEKIRTDAAWS